MQNIHVRLYGVRDSKIFRNWDIDSNYNPTSNYRLEEWLKNDYYHSFSKPNVCLTRLQMELRRAANIFAAR